MTNVEHQAANSLPVEKNISQLPVESKNNKISLILSDGRKAVVRKATGLDLRQAMRAADGQEERGMALAAFVTQIDGQSLIYEDFLALDLDDCFAITNASNELLGKSISQELGGS